ncbi:dihydroorotase [Micavibrio aeruginosavorus]|uniref:Dihydroorotase n=1 Tax=Micavibrio aeruginosavorus EPB TaxID=349215 RepID=M4VCR3_9BACT|nr:dihydroorotase [Micavibrio aeruginosavorus]AGH96988.1 Dihydroorotase [Micavibrio aeruginosavorus EPB]
MTQAPAFETPGFDLILAGGTVMTPGGRAVTDVGVRDGQIVALGDLRTTSAANRVDCAGLHILPGVIDTQVHFREPGLTHKEDIEHGTMAAAAGGVTAIFDMPNVKPLTTTPETLADKMHLAARAPWVDYAFYFGGTATNATQLAAWENLPGVCGIKIFMGSSTGDLLCAEDDHIENILRHGKRVVAAHAEDEAMMNANKGTLLGDSHDVRLHPVWRSVESCVSATTRLIRLARKTGRRVHILHISTAEELEIIKDHKDIVSCEVLPNHLSMAAPDCYERLGTRAQQNPPIREQRHQDALWAAVNNGLIDILGSDHAAHTIEEKNQTYPASPSGTPGVQTLVPIMLNHIHHGRLSLERFVELVSYGPQRIHQIANKGRIALGYDADFTIVDLNAERTITNAQQKSKCGWTPYDGMRVTGWPIMTVVRGHIVMREDELIGGPAGTPVRFRESL